MNISLSVNNVEIVVWRTFEVKGLLEFFLDSFDAIFYLKSMGEYKLVFIYFA